MTRILGFDHPSRCGGTSIMFDTLGTIFGFETMLVWGDDFPLDFKDFQRVISRESPATPEITPKVIAGHLLDPGWALPRWWGTAGRISWVTQIRNPREQLRSARRYQRKAEPRLSRAILAATLIRVVQGEYEMVGVLGHPDLGQSLAWLLHERFGLPYVIPTTRNSASSHLRDINVQDVDWPSEYTPFEYQGYEMLDLWEMALAKVELMQVSNGRPHPSHQGAFPAIASPPAGGPILSADWVQDSRSHSEFVEFSSRISARTLPKDRKRIVAMVRVKTSDHRGTMYAHQTTGKTSLHLRRISRPFPSRWKRRTSSWARRDLFGLGSHTSVLHSEGETWAGVAFSPQGRGDLVVRLRAPASTHIKILSECLIFPAF